MQLCTREEAAACKETLAAGLREKEGMDDEKLERWFTVKVGWQWSVWRWSFTWIARLSLRVWKQKMARFLHRLCLTSELQLLLWSARLLMLGVKYK